MRASRFLQRGLANARRVLRHATESRPPRGGWLRLELDGRLSERNASSSGGSGGQPLGLLDCLRCLEAAAADPELAGVCLLIRGSFGSWSQALSLRRVLDALREAGKPLAVWAESLSAPQYLMASAADRIWLPESGSLHLVGLRSERFFLRELLGRFAIEPEVINIGEFKSAGEGLTRSAMSPEEREQIERWQGDLFDELVGAIARGRGLSEAAVRARIDAGPYAAPAAREAGLIDACHWPDELERALEALAREAFEGAAARESRRVRFEPAVRYMAERVCDSAWQPLLRDRPRLVYLPALGAVRRGAGGRGITSEGLGRLLDSLAEESLVRGVLLRVDSPGGDALASDLLYRGVERLRREKPVVVSMGDVAASGGYFIAAAADALFAESGTLTGSIGVIGGKLNLAGFYARVGVAADAVQHGARAGLLSAARGFTPDERRAIRGEMEALYTTFIERVAHGRGLATEVVEKLAHGRVYGGRHACELGLVDVVGGPLEALRELARLAGLRSDEGFDLEVRPREPWWVRSLRERGVTWPVTAGLGSGPGA